MTRAAQAFFGFPPTSNPCLAGFFALRCFSLITIWVTPESWAVKLITPLPHWFYTRILRVPKCFSPQAFRLTPKSAHNLGCQEEENDTCYVRQPFPDQAHSKCR